jgi:hypothetical protein
MIYTDHPILLQGLMDLGTLQYAGHNNQVGKKETGVVFWWKNYVEGGHVQDLKKKSTCK